MISIYIAAASKKDRTKRKRPPALATIVLRAGRDVGSTALIVVVDIARKNSPYVGAKYGLKNRRIRQTIGIEGPTMDESSVK